MRASIVRRQSRPACDFIARDPATGMFADETQGLVQIRVFDGKHIRALSCADSGWADNLNQGHGLFPRHHLIENFRRNPSRTAWVRVNAGQRLRTQFAQQFIIIHPENRHLFRHSQVGAVTGIQNLPPTRIVTSEYRHRLGQVLEPACDVIGLAFAVVAAFLRALIQVTGQTFCGESFDKKLPALARPRKARHPAVGEMFETAIEEMRGR